MAGLVGPGRLQAGRGRVGAGVADRLGPVGGGLAGRVGPGGRVLWRAGWGRVGPGGGMGWLAGGGWASWVCGWAGMGRLR